MNNLTAVVAVMAVFTLAVRFIMIGSISVELTAKLDLGKADIGTGVTTSQRRQPIRAGSAVECRSL